MAILKLKSLRCIRKQDVTGKDEPRLKVDGVAVWNGVVAEGGTVDIGWEGEFQAMATVIAEETNDAKPRQIGAAAHVFQSGNPPFLTFKTSGAWYEVDFEVTSSAAASMTARRTSVA